MSICPYDDEWYYEHYQHKIELNLLEGSFSSSVWLNWSNTNSLCNYFPIYLRHAVLLRAVQHGDVLKMIRPFVMQGFVHKETQESSESRGLNLTSHHHSKHSGRCYLSELSRLLALAAGEWATRKPSPSKPVHRRFPLRDQVRWGVSPSDFKHSRYSIIYFIIASLSLMVDNSQTRAIYFAESTLQTWRRFISYAIILKLPLQEHI